MADMKVDLNTIAEYKAKAMGSGGEGAQSNLQEAYSEALTLAEAEGLALATLKQVMEDKLTDDNVDVARVTDSIHALSPRDACVTVGRLRAHVGPAADLEIACTLGWISGRARP